MKKEKLLWLTKPIRNALRDTAHSQTVNLNMENLNVLEILKLGAIGLGFLLALLSYRLLVKEQSQTEPRESILKAVRTYMIFALTLVLIASIGEFVNPKKTSTTEDDDFNFEDYVSSMRIKHENGQTPENFISGSLDNLEMKTLTLNLPAGACRSFLAVTSPDNEIDISWWTNGNGARDVTFNESGSENVIIGDFCTKEELGKEAQIGIQIKMVKGKGPFSLEVFFESQRMWDGDNN